MDRLSWDSPIWLTQEDEGELRFWLENIEKMNFEGSYISQLTVEFTQGQKPGRCFNCGVKGHWTQECPDLKKSDKISIADNNKFEFGFSNPTDNALQLKSH